VRETYAGFLSSPLAIGLPASIFPKRIAAGFELVQTAAGGFVSDAAADVAGDEVAVHD